MASSLMERDRQSKQVMRIKIPGPLQLRYGVRAIIDEDQLMRARFFTCYANACIADFPIAAEVAQKLRRAQTLTIEAICLDGAAVSFHVPMSNFRESEDGPAADVKLFDEQEREFLVKLGNSAVAQQGELIDVPRTRFAAEAGTKVALSKVIAKVWAPLSRVVTSNADASALEGQQFLAAIRRAVFSNTVAEWRDKRGLNPAARTADNTPNKRRRQISSSPSGNSAGTIGSDSGSNASRSSDSGNQVSRPSSN
jgi:hypothetical protein